MSDRLNLEIANRLEELEGASQQVSDYLEERGADMGAVYAASLALEELITNIIKYGYDDREGHRIAIRLAVEGGRFCLEVIDDGHPFNPFDRPEPDTSGPIEEREIGGLGIHFIRNMLEECRYERRGGENVVTVCKALVSG